MMRSTSVKTSRGPPAWWGGGRRRTAIEGKYRRNDKGNQHQNPPADRQRGGGGETTKGENQHEMERWHNLHAQQREDKIAYETKKIIIITHSPVLQHEQPDYPGHPPGSGLRRASAGRKRNEHEKPTVPCLNLGARLPRPWPSTECCGDRHDGIKNARTTQSPAQSGKKHLKL